MSEEDLFFFFSEKERMRENIECRLGLGMS